MIQLLEALKYLDSRRVIHRDIKSSNVYLTVDGNLKLGDFGIAKVLSCTSDVAQTVVGTPYYMSPEVCENKPYTSKSDIWSLGCLFYEITSLTHPFTGKSFLALVMNILKESPPSISNNYSQELQTVIKLMLTKDMKIRPNATNILKMQYFQKFKEPEESYLELSGSLSYDMEYETNQSHDSDEVEIGSKVNGLGISGINPLELVNTGNFDASCSEITDYNYSITIPTFTPDMHATEKNFFKFEESKKGAEYKTFQKSNQKIIRDDEDPDEDPDEYEYEDDFESVYYI